MSSSGQVGPGERKEEPKGLKKFIRRASLALKPKSKRSSVSDVSAFASKDSSAVAPSGSTAPTSPPAAASPPTEPEVASALPVPVQITQSTKDNEPATAPIKSQERMTAKQTNMLLEEKAKALFAKYGLTLEPGEWTVPVAGGAPRIEKQVRMRVHRTCHRCQTPFGQDKLCSNCSHTRCKKCPRFPGSKAKAAKGKGATIGGILIDDGATQSNEALTMAHRATGKEMTRRPPTQRVRRTCHECKTLFLGKAVQCENCKHTRCEKCLRDPPKNEKYPDGYPGDVNATGGSRDASWNCEKCDIPFEDPEKPCDSCGHVRCNNCPQASPAKTQAPKDQATIQAMEERMRRLDVSPQAPAA